MMGTCFGMSYLMKPSTDSTLFRTVGNTGVRKYLRSRLVFGEHGSSLVEDALALGILLTLLFGVIQVSLALNSYLTVSQAAREAARYAMVRGSSCSGFTSACPATAANVQTYIQGYGFPGLAGTSITVTTTWPTTGGACTPSTTPCNNPGNLVRVNVSYPFSLRVPYIATSALTLQSTSQVVISR